MVAHINGRDLAKKHVQCYSKWFSSTINSATECALYFFIKEKEIKN